MSFIFRSYIVYATNKMLKHSTIEKPKMQFSNSQQEYYSFNTILRITSRFRCLYNVHGKNWSVTLVQLITYNGGDTNNNAVTGSLSIVLVRTMRHKGHQGLYIIMTKLTVFQSKELPKIGICLPCNKKGT